MTAAVRGDHAGDQLLGHVRVYMLHRGTFLKCDHEESKGRGGPWK